MLSRKNYVTIIILTRDRPGLCRGALELINADAAVPMGVSCATQLCHAASHVARLPYRTHRSTAEIIIIQYFIYLLIAGYHRARL